MNLKLLLKNILIPNIIGFLGGLIGNAKDGFKGINKPDFAPPGLVFPIVWTILYILMGISAYLVENSNHPQKKDALRYYYVSLILNASWTFFFFKLKWFLFSSILVLIILYFVIETIRRYFKINKTAAYLQIPYVLWLLFAGFLSFSVWTLNP